mgnify:FL=1
MLLGARLRTVAELIGDYRRVADIGSDHAYLPAWLILQDKADFVVAGEIQAGPLEAANRTVCEAALEDCIAVRLGDGLTVLQPGEVDMVVIAGMGGPAISGILTRSPEIVRRLSRIVCQPMTGAAGLRRWLQENGWMIVAEELVWDEGRLYEVLAAEPGLSEPLSDLLLEVGPLLWRQRHPLLPAHFDRLLHQYQNRVQSMKQSHCVNVAEQRGVWERKIEALEAMKACL